VENRFTSSLLLVSSVSGGSLGSMYLVGSYAKDGHIPDEALENVRRDSAKTSLSAVGWGLLYPDFARTIPLLGWALDLRFHGRIDRGWALENQWLQHWEGRARESAPTIGQWIDDVNEGKRPAAIFNGTAAENGRRVLVGST